MKANEIEKKESLSQDSRIYLTLVDRMNELQMQWLTYDHH